eukprot:jgi/Mesvir1/22103/Mv18708-RA.1
MALGVNNGWDLALREQKALEEETAKGQRRRRKQNRAVLISKFDDSSFSEEESEPRDYNQSGNPGLLRWHQQRAAWCQPARDAAAAALASGRGLPSPASPVLGVVVPYEEALALNRPYAHSIPLAEMVDYLIDQWVEEGLYKNM